MTNSDQIRHDNIFIGRRHVLGLVPPQPKGQGTIAPNVKDPLHASQDGMIHSNQILHGDQIIGERNF